MSRKHDLVDQITRGIKAVDRGGFMSAIGDVQRAVEKVRRTARPFVANLNVTASEEAEFNREVAKFIRVATQALREFGTNTRKFY